MPMESSALEGLHDLLMPLQMQMQIGALTPTQYAEMSGAIMRERGIGFGARYTCIVDCVLVYSLGCALQLVCKRFECIVAKGFECYCSISGHGSFYSTACPFKCNVAD